MTIYYRYWAQIQNLDMNQRVLISVGIVVIFLFMVLKITYRLWKGGFYKLSMKLRIIWYLLISDLYYDTLVVMRRSDGGRKVRERQNLFSEKCQRKYENTEQAWHALKDGEKKLSFLWGLTIYLLLICAILVPRVTHLYLPGLSEISFAYEKIDQTSLEAAQAYTPFWKLPEEDVETVSIGQEEEIEEEINDEIWLQLSNKGWNGANIREEANKDSDRITIISGQVSMKQLEVSKDERWIRIELEDGTQGWINHTLVEAME